VQTEDKINPKLQNETIVPWRLLSSCHEAKYYKTTPACAWQCMRFWQH